MLGGGASFVFVNSEAAAYVAAMAVAPSNSRKAAIDSFFTAAKARSYWSKMEWLSFVASHDAQAARINAIHPAQVASLVGSPVFTVDKGYTGDDSNYLDTGRILSTNGGTFTLNSSHVGAWNMTSSAASGLVSDREFTNGNAELFTNSSSSMFLKANSAQFSFLVDHIVLGHMGWSRTASNAISIFRSRSPFTTSTQVSTSVSALAMRFGKSRRSCGVMHYGAGLTDTEWSNLHDDLAAYLNATEIIPAFDVFLIIGDSNNHNGLGYDSSIDVVSSLVWAHQDVIGTGEEPIQGVLPNWYGGPTIIGYDVAFLRDFYIANSRLGSKRRALIVKASGGGTGLFTAGQEWRPTKVNYVGAVRQINEALSVFPNATFKAILGCEGANDATVSADPTLFETQYDLMLTSLRSDITGGATIPIIMAGIPPNYLGTGTAAGLQAKIAAVGSRITGAAYANPSSPTVLNHTSDPIHYDAQDDRGTSGSPGGMAGRFWTAWVSLGL